MGDSHLITTKQVKIDKANSTIVAVIAASAFVIIFCLVASKTLISQYSYQSRVLSARQKTVNQINQDIQATSSLENSYQQFVSGSTNMIGGIPAGTGPRDGSNSALVLDALPPKYDFPQVATGVQNLITIPGVTINSITGTDAGNGTSTAPGTTAAPLPSTLSTSTSLPTASSTKTIINKPVAIPFTFSVKLPYSSIGSVLNNLQASIRPIQIQSLDISGSTNNLTLTVNAQTYYLVNAGLKISTETVK